jgi:hypothetical protein
VVLTLLPVLMLLPQRQPPKKGVRVVQLVVGL